MIAVRQVRGQLAACRVNDGGFVEGRPSVVFVHGAGRNQSVWESQAEALQSLFNCCSINLPGHEPSAGEACDSVCAYSEWVRDAICAFEISRPVLVGHSLGAAIALDLAIRFPAALSAVVSVGGGARMPVNPQTLKLVVSDPEAALDMSIRFAVAKGNRDRVGPLLKSIYRTGPDTVFRDLTACDRLDLVPVLGGISVPTLIVCGAEDRMTPPERSEALAGGIPGARLCLIPGAGHYPMMETADPFNAALLEFVRDVSEPGRAGIGE